MADKTLTPLQQAALALRRMRARVDTLEQAARAPVAVVGLACRYPGGAVDGEHLWRNLVNGVDATSEIPGERWDVDAHYDPRPGVPGKMYTRRGGFIDRVDEFDAQFFRIAPRDAIGIDPQQRLLLQTVWHALEDAGLPPPSLQGRKVGVFLGISTNDYSNLLSKTAFGSSSNAGAGAGNAASVASGRISYTFDFQGPCVAIDTACSSSLVATHLAVQALRAGECEIAVVAGVNLMLAPDITVNFCQARMLSPDGRCKTFDAGADGYARAEGCGVVVLKRLADAGADQVRALIAGSAINQDGRSAGLTAPSGPAQEAVIRAAIANAGLTPAEVDAIEAHGTGTGLGDPIEMHALAAVFQERDRPLWVGSIKSNMGHAEAAAGVGGLIKAVLMAERGQIAPSLHFDTLNPHIDVQGADIRVPVQAQPIPPRAVGVSSFGFSGTNAHIVVTPPPPICTNEPERPAGHVPRLLISARTPAALAELVASYRELLAADPASFPDVCHSAATGRARLPWWVCVERPEDLASAEPQHGRHPEIGPQPGRRVKLPAYPFERQRYWIDTSPAPAAVAATTLPEGVHPLLGRPVHLPFSDERRFETALHAADPGLPWLAEHRVHGQAVLPAAALLELLHAAAPGQEIQDLDLLLPVQLPEQPGLHLHTILAADGTCRIVSWNALDPSAPPRLHARARLVAPGEPPALPEGEAGASLPLAGFFTEMERRGIGYGPAFRGLRELRRTGEGQVAASVALPEEAGSANAFTLHPALLDAALQAVAGALPADDASGTLVPARFTRARLLRRPESALRVQASARRNGAHVLADLRVDDTAGLVAFCAGLEFRPITAAMLADAGNAIAADAFYTIEPEPCPLVDGLSPPDFLPEPADLCRELAPVSAATGERLGIGVYAETAPALDRITAAFVQRALLDLGLEWQPGRLLTPNALAAELEVADRHRRLFRRLLAILAGAGMLEPVGPAFRILPVPPAADPVPELDALIAAHPGAAAELGLVRRAGPRLADVLAERVDPLTLLFPSEGGGAADLYGSSAYARTVNTLLGEAITGLRDRLPQGRLLRILEIGAGTGGATGALLEALPEGIARYAFTDLSPVFLDAAKARFPRADLAFARLDIEQDPQPQGFGEASQDLVVAANVIHATRDLRESLAHIHELLAPGGLLVLVETTEPRPWVDIVFGLTEGWWRFADRELRQDHPLLGRERWLEVLEQAGFVADALPAGEIILARKPLAEAATPSVRVLGDRSGVALADSVGAGQAIYVAPAAAATMAGQLDLFDDLLATIRQLIAEPTPPALAILSDGSLGHAGLAGFLRTLRLEQPKLRARLLEVPPTERALHDELAAPDGESHVLWRDGRRQAPRLRPARLPEPAGHVSGSWIVTGGSGDVGRVAAAWLAGHGASRIVLVSRTRPAPMPDLAVPVDLYAADAADEAAMAAIMAGLPDLGGIVHAAGLLDDAPVGGQNRARFAAVMRGKVEAALVLDRLTRSRPGARLVLFASAAGVLGSAEQANHAAASSFLDALARERTAAGLPTVSIDWGIWREIGAAARLGVVERAEKLGLGSIGPAQGRAAFAAALADGVPAQLAVLPGVDWQRFLGQFPAGETPDLLQGLTSSRAASGDVPAGQPQDEAGPAERLSRIVADVVGLPHPADPDTPLPDFGLDSLMAVEIRNRVQRELGIELGVRELLEGIDIRTIAARAGDPADAAPVRRIEPDLAARHEPFPLTEIQQAYWIGRGDTLELGNVGCYLYTEVELRDVDLPRLERAWNMLVRRHDMLRAIVLADGRQQILAEVPDYRIEEHGLDGQDEAAQLLAIRERLSHRLPDPAVWPLFDIRVTRHAGGRRLHIGLDLLVLDAASIFQLREEWGRLYEDPATALPPIGLSFRDFVLEGLAWRQSPAWQESARYWQERLPTLPGGPDLPLARQPGQIDRPRFVRRMATLPADLWSRLQSAGQAQGLTPSALLAAAYADILASWSRSARFCLNLTSFNRPPLHPDMPALIGDFTSTILLEVDATPAAFAERAVALQKRLAQDLDHAEVGGVHVLRELARTRGVAAASIPVVFTSALGFRAPDGAKSSWDRISDMVHSVAQTPQVWIDHQASEHEGGLLLTWDVVEDLFPAGVVDAMFAAYRRLLDSLASGEGWAGAVGASVDLPPRPAPVVAFTPEPLFAGLLRQAEQAPDRPALIDASGQTSFAELARLSALAAGRLLALGAGPEKVVAVDLPKSRQQALAALAVLRSGAAYLPLDPALPPARRAELIADTAAIVPDWPALLDGQGELIDLPAVDPASLAYVIFTSGSTGKPKGVMVEHGAALNTVVDLNRRWKVGPADRVLGLSALNFDLSVYDLFGVPAAGGALVLPGEEQRRDPAAWAELVRRHRVTIWNTVPALAAMLAEHGLDPDHQLRLFLLSGDWIPLELVPKLRALAPDAELVSLGGATEAAIWSIFHPIGEPDPAWASVPYGQPLSNQTMHVVDAHGRPCPDWVVGEIEIGGIGLARGYWGDPARTEERFRRDPLTGQRRYRTGDLGRFRPDHLIEFLGREDFQVKVGGHRIELGEIEAHLVQHPAVRQAVAAALPVPGQPRQKTLHAFVVAKDGVADADLWPDAVQVAGEAVAATAAPIEPDLFQAAADRLARFTAGAAAAALERLGGFSGGLPVDADGLPDIDALMARCGIVPGYRRWLSRTLELIRRFGRDAAADDPLRDFAAFDRFGFGAQDLDLLRRLTSELPDILCGKKHAGDIYLDAGTLDVYAKLFQAPYQVLGQTIRRLAELRRVNVLEVGAGLGTTLVGLQPHLPLDRITYHFTDVSPHFIHMAERRLGTPPWLRLSRLDLMAPVEAAAELHDVVIASSVLHAVPDVETALASIRQRLRPGGILVILEETRFQPWYDMSMGLQSGFDSFSDRYRVRHPLLGREAWRDVLAEAGFGRVEIPAAPGSLGDQLGLDVILASLPAFDGPASAGPVDEFGPELRRFLAERLPDYMVPRFVHRLARLPLTANGKVDRSALGTVAVHEEGTASPDEQPASPAEQRIATLVGEVLDCAPPPPGRSFFDLGADSLKLVMVQRRLRETTGRSLDMTALFADPTVRGIAAALDLPAEAEPARKLVMFNKPSGRPILFTVPGVVALPYYLRELARELEPVATLAGLQLPGFFGGEAPLDRIEAQAAHLVAAMRAQQPRGPYLLLGHSYGGTVAFEAARQLRFQGEEIGFLGVLDTVVTESSLDDFQNDQVAQGSIVRALYALYGDRLPVPLEEVRALPPDEQLARTMQALGQGGLVDLSVAVDGVLEVFKANFRAMVAYTPGRYDGPFTLYRTEGGFPEEYYEYESGKALDDPALGWSGFLDGRLEIEDLPGDHLSLLDAAHLPNLAARLKRRIEAAMAVEAR